MSSIEKIKEQLKRYPQITLQVEGNTISVKPVSQSGFTVWLTDHNSSFTVGYDGWHEEFEDEIEALNCFHFGLSSKCRLKVTKRGDKAYSWTVEFKDGNDWKEDSTTGLILVPFWKKKKIEYLCNSIIQSSE
jgi:hypothetical protein